MNTKVTIRAADVDADEAVLLNLWQAVFGARWPLDRRWLRAVAFETPVYRPGDVLLAERSGQPAGFALTQPGGNGAGAILAMGVRPDIRLQGAGHALHSAAVDRLRERGTRQIHLGSCGSGYFWPGVPEGSACWGFFAALGYEERWRAVDMVQDLRGYATPAWVRSRVAGQGVWFGSAAQGDASAVVDFVHAEYPSWEDLYASAFQSARPEQVILARQGEGGVVLGACLLDYPSTRWANCFEATVGAPGCILVGEAARGRGIGMAMTAYATEQLQAIGCPIGFIGFTYLEDWYAKLGYQTWERYLMTW
jgi:ribosomal protein S18 acetylase RimI-like enzyme